MPSIGEVAARAGASVSAIRVHEARGLIASARSAGGQRRTHRSQLRRLSFIRVARILGLSPGEISKALAGPPDGRTPAARDWARISASIRSALDAQIARLERMRDRLDGCIGCGCLSMKRCALYNAGDHDAKRGPGARFILEAGDPAK